MDYKSQQVLKVIPVGRENTLSSRDITLLTGLAEREIQHIIQALRLEGYPVAAAVKPPLGYYIPRNETEAGEYEAHIRARIKSQCIALNCVRRAFRKPPVGIQEQLDLLDKGA